jgi:hypothetical protein
VIDQYMVAGPPQAVEESHPITTMNTVMDTQVHLHALEPRAPPPSVELPAPLAALHQTWQTMLR